VVAVELLQQAEHQAAVALALLATTHPVAVQPTQVAAVDHAQTGLAAMAAPVLSSSKSQIPTAHSFRLA
jgi:hypothetical protein